MDNPQMDRQRMFPLQWTWIVGWECRLRRRSISTRPANGPTWPLASRHCPSLTNGRDGQNRTRSSCTSIVATLCQVVGSHNVTRQSFILNYFDNIVLGPHFLPCGWAVGDASSVRMTMVGRARSVVVSTSFTSSILSGKTHRISFIFLAFITTRKAPPPPQLFCLRIYGCFFYTYFMVWLPGRLLCKVEYCGELGLAFRVEVSCTVSLCSLFCFVFQNNRTIHQQLAGFIFKKTKRKKPRACEDNQPILFFTRHLFFFCLVNGAKKNLPRWRRADNPFKSLALSRAKTDGLAVLFPAASRPRILF